MESKNLMLTGQRRISRIFQYHLARLLNQNYPRQPCAHSEKLKGTTLRPSFFKSRRFRILPIQRKKRHFSTPGKLGYPTSSGSGPKVTECGRQRSKVKTLLLQRCALRKLNVIDGQNTLDQTRVIEGPNASNQLRCTKFILSGSPNECWLHTCDASVVTPWD